MAPASTLAGCHWASVVVRANDCMRAPSVPVGVSTRMCTSLRWMTRLLMKPVTSRDVIEI